MEKLLDLQAISKNFGQQLVLDTIRAEVALLRGMGVRVDEELIVRAGFHAGPAADA